MLEIQVFDQITVTDDLEKTIEYVIEAVKKWHNEDQTNPIIVTVRRATNKGPPPLEINVHETINVKSVFGTR